MRQTGDGLGRSPGGAVSAGVIAAVGGWRLAVGGWRLAVGGVLTAEDAARGMGSMRTLPLRYPIGF